MTAVLSLRRRTGTARRGRHRDAPAPAPPKPRRRRVEGPQDRALYACHCGMVWTGAVTTEVGCPHCGTAQAW